MPVTVTIQQLLDYLGGTGGASPRTFYGLTVPDGTINSRAIEPAAAFYDNQFSAGTITAKQALADKAALMRAAAHLLAHLRTLLLAGGKVNSYSIGNMSVTKQDLLGLLREALTTAEQEEQRLQVLLYSAGERADQTDLTFQNPIETADGNSRIHLDHPPYGGFI